MGAGNRVQLWHDRWCGDVPLREVYPNLFDCSSNQEDTIDFVLQCQIGGVAWNVSFNRNFNDWEMEDVAAFLDHLYSHTLANSDNDVVWWRLKKNGLFDFRSFYYAIRGSPMVIFPWKSVWCSKVPRRVCFFVWSVAWRRILTCDNLIRRGYTMTSWCCMCLCNGESVDCLLIHCLMAGSLWNFVLRSFGIQWVPPNQIMDLLDGWWNMLRKHTSAIWNLVPPYLL